MRVLNEEPMQTLHLFVVPEDQWPRKSDYPSIALATIAFLCIFAILGISVFSKAPENEVSFTISVPTFRLPAVSKTLKTTVTATGKGRRPATIAGGMITFYNGAIYSQIIPVGTILKGSDGVAVITTQQAVIPPAAQTTPPTYGHTNVLAQATIAGEGGNIVAGDINMACCASSVIAQNPYSFTGGTNARDFTFLTSQDMSKTISPLLPTLQSSVLSNLPAPQLNPSCSTKSTSEPAVGKETKTARVAIVETCSAMTYSVPLVVHTISTYTHRFGKGTLTHIEFFQVDTRKGAVVLYVTGRWMPFERKVQNAGK